MSDRLIPDKRSTKTLAERLRHLYAHTIDKLADAPDAAAELSVLREAADAIDAASVLAARLVLGIPPKSDTARVLPEHSDPAAWWDDVEEKLDAFLALERSAASNAPTMPSRELLQTHEAVVNEITRAPRS